jgi:alpha-L-fucosidase
MTCCLVRVGPEYAQLLHDGSEIRMEVIDPHEQAQNTKLGGIGEGTLTVKLPVQRPAVAVPVIELFLREAGAP